MEKGITKMDNKTEEKNNDEGDEEEKKLSPVNVVSPDRGKQNREIKENRADHNANQVVDSEVTIGESPKRKVNNPYGCNKKLKHLIQKQMVMARMILD